MVAPMNWRIAGMPEPSFNAPGVQYEVLKIAEWLWRFYGYAGTWTPQTLEALTKLDPTDALDSPARSPHRWAFLQLVADALEHSGFDDRGQKVPTIVH